MSTELVPFGEPTWQAAITRLSVATADEYTFAADVLKKLKAFQKDLLAAEKILKGKLEQYDQAQIQAAELEMAAARAEGIIAPVAPATPEVKGISHRRHFTFNISDALALPREFLMPDTVKIGRVVRVMGFDAKIPGVTVIESTITAVRA